MAEIEKDRTVGEILIEQNKTVITLLQRITEQNEALISIAQGTAILKGGETTNPYERVEKMFPDDIRAKLDLKVEGNTAIAKFKHFQTKDIFSVTADIVKQLGGKYVSAGKESHFEIPLEKVKQT